MKKLFEFALVGIVAFVGGTLIPSARTEPQTQTKVQLPKYYLVDCMKVKPGKGDQYLQVEKEWKSFHQRYVNMRKKRSWGLYEVRYPSGTEARCDYITVNSFDNYADTENPLPKAEEVFKKTFPNTKPEDFFQRTGDSRDLTHSEFLVLVDHTD